MPINNCDRAVFEHERVEVVDDLGGSACNSARDTAGDQDDDQTIAPSLIDSLQLTRAWQYNSVAGDGRLRANGFHELGDRMFGKMACDIGFADDPHQPVVVDHR